ncbi:S53 family peptidase [Labedaea rhizosphaerae]|uniref:Subtilase family protein n=1 Tax=Labedaea rhizosphaerae TaxID=598644 RepID=A0A4R6S8B0_LABRH|nr:S53 family peptidase [Labedaea rhizosphaerae]TDP95086.1 subtilase family protein [Labedaea rhizosphaerae]
MNRLIAAIPALVTLATMAVPAAATPEPSTAHAVCGAAQPGHVRCYAQVRGDVHGTHGVRPLAAPPQGYGPADLRDAYDLPETGAAHQTIAIVDMGDDPSAEADLAVYRQTYGLPPCTTENGCFKKVNQRGDASPLPQDWGWGPEISLDLDMASAACPSCSILLVEADDPGLANAAEAENTAVALGADVVSNSYGIDESNGLDKFAAAYKHPGVAIVASSGDSGYGIPSFPAVLDSVVGVGGTSLTKADNARGWTESAWNRASSGCSAWFAKPAWQHDENCPGRMVADVAAVADPNTGPAVYDSYDGYGWTVIGGTSASAPYLSGVIALAGHAERFGDASSLYTAVSGLNDVTAGSNARYTDCGGDYQCTSGPGYDGPTGMGTPAGLAAFGG